MHESWHAHTDVHMQTDAGYVLGLSGHIIVRAVSPSFSERRGQAKLETDRTVSFSVSFTIIGSFLCCVSSSMSLRALKTYSHLRSHVDGIPSSQLKFHASVDLFIDFLCVHFLLWKSWGHSAMFTSNIWIIDYFWPRGMFSVQAHSFETFVYEMIYERKDGYWSFSMPQCTCLCGLAYWVMHLFVVPLRKAFWTFLLICVSVQQSCLTHTRFVAILKSI